MLLYLSRAKYYIDCSIRASRVTPLILLAVAYKLWQWYQVT